MKTTMRMLALYLAVVLVLSCINISYTWLDPLPPSGESMTPIECYSTVGLRMGKLFSAGYFYTSDPVGSLSFGVQLPDSEQRLLFLFPFFAGGGPEGGVTFISVWFVALLVWAAHMFWRSKWRRKS